MSGHHHHHHDRDRFGNPGDLQDYVRRMEDPSRDDWQKPAEVLRALRLPAQAVVGEIGAGPGYFSLRLAKAAAWVFAAEVEPRLIEVLRQRIEQAHATNVTPVLALPADPLLPPSACDLILIADAYHHFADGPAYLRRLARSLKPGGHIANLDFHEGDLPVGPESPHKVPRAAFLRDAAAAGLRVVHEETFLPYQYFLLLQP